ncbi:MAG TPA: MaoC/PaaZ C-terminal domain-containing protein [Myxococcota bacterium]|jgi:acyl dehydratase
MPIDPKKALGAQLGEGKYTWTRDQVILYHLGVGAGVPATDRGELEYTYEKNLKVLPSYGVVPVFGALGSIGNIPGLSFNFAMLLHGEQDIEIHQPIPPEATVSNAGRVAGIYDKGKAALVVLEVKTRDEAGKPLFTNRFSLFLRGEGGFGGDSGPKAGNEAPTRAPDGVITSTTLPQQALIYRLSGDKNPLHADPDFAKMGGFDKPIIHGLCSYGIVCKAIVDKVLGGDVTKVARYQARFAGVGFPGETYLTSYWQEGDKILIQAKSKERDAVIISNAAITVRR